MRRRGRATEVQIPIQIWIKVKRQIQMKMHIQIQIVGGICFAESGPRHEKCKRIKYFTPHAKCARLYRFWIYHLYFTTN